MNKYGMYSIITLIISIFPKFIPIWAIKQTRLDFSYGAVFILGLNIQGPTYVEIGCCYRNVKEQLH